MMVWEGKAITGGEWFRFLHGYADELPEEEYDHDREEEDKSEESSD